MILGTGDFLINSRELLDGVLKVIAPLDHWTEKEQTQAEVETFKHLHFGTFRCRLGGSVHPIAYEAMSVFRYLWKTKFHRNPKNLLT